MIDGVKITSITSPKVGIGRQMKDILTSAHRSLNVSARTNVARLKVDAPSPFFHRRTAIKNANGRPFREQPFHQMRTDEAGSAGHKDHRVFGSETTW